MAIEAVVNAIASQDWLQEAGDPLQRAILSLFGSDRAGRAVKDLLHGTWLGHPLHPVLVNVPIGAWTVALVFDAFEGLGGSDDLAAGADAAIGIGILGALGAAVTGATDWSETGGRSEKIGLFHGLLNVATTGIYTASWIARRKRRRDTGVALSMLGFALGSAAAYLGGHLVFGEQVGVDHTATADAEEPEHFTAVMLDSALKEGEPKRVEANGVKVMLLRYGGKIRAFHETCPHLGGPLSEGTLVGDAIECPWHGSQFRIDDGSVVSGPATAPARCLDVRVHEGNIEVRSSLR